MIYLPIKAQNKSKKIQRNGRNRKTKKSALASYNYPETKNNEKYKFAFAYQ